MIICPITLVSAECLKKLLPGDFKSKKYLLFRFPKQRILFGSKKDVYSFNRNHFKPYVNSDFEYKVLSPKIPIYKNLYNSVFKLKDEPDTSFFLNYFKSYNYFTLQEFFIPKENKYDK